MCLSAGGWPINPGSGDGLLLRLQASQVAAASRGRKVIESGPFTILLNEHSELVWFNYAIPNREGFSDQAIADMKLAFYENGRVPRLEFLESLWPSLGEWLSNNGFSVQGRVPLMLCDAESFRPVNLADRDVRILSADDDIPSYVSVGSLAFGEVSTPEEQRVARHRLQIAEGSLRCAMAYCEGLPAAVACTMPESGVAELAGVGTRQEFRRRGLASAVSSILMEDLFRSDPRALVWLGAGDDVAKAVYEGLGFRTIGFQLFYIQAGA